jgi:O-antigen ligase
MGHRLWHEYRKVPANNKYKIVSSIPPDSTYVYIWVHTGVLGVTLFVIVNVLILLGGCRVVLFKLHNKVLCGIGAAFCCGFIGINLGGYGNQISNAISQRHSYTMVGWLLVYLLPKLEPAYIEFEKKDNQRLLEIKKKKEEEKNASRV